MALIRIVPGYGHSDAYTVPITRDRKPIRQITEYNTSYLHVDINRLSVNEFEYLEEEIEIYYDGELQNQPIKYYIINISVLIGK